MTGVRRGVAGAVAGVKPSGEVPDAGKFLSRLQGCESDLRHLAHVTSNLLSEPLRERSIDLALTKRIAELHGGSIGVRSEPGAGATFTFTLPVAPVRHALAAA